MTHMAVLGMAALPIAVDVAEIMNSLTRRKSGKGAQSAANRASAFLLVSVHGRGVNVAAVSRQQLGTIVAAFCLLCYSMACHSGVNLCGRGIVRLWIVTGAIESWPCNEETGIGHVTSESRRQSRLRVLCSRAQLWDRLLRGCLLWAHGVVVFLGARARANLGLFKLLRANDC